MYINVQHATVVFLIYRRTGNFRGWKFSRLCNSMYYVNNLWIFIFAVGGDRHSLQRTSQPQSSSLPKASCMALSSSRLRSAYPVEAVGYDGWQIESQLFAQSEHTSELTLQLVPVVRSRYYTRFKAEDKRQLYLTC